MSLATTFHTQLASIMELLANTAVAEICELVDSGYAVLQMEISRSRKENEVLRRKLRLMELRASRASALRAAATGGGGGGGGSALLHAGGRTRVQLLLQGAEPRRNGTPTGQVALSRLSTQESTRCKDPSPPAAPPSETAQPVEVEATAIIKVEDDDESWSQPETDKVFCPVAQGQTTDAEALSPLVKQEAEDNSDSASQSWMSGEVSSTSMSNQQALSTSQSSETSSYDRVLFEAPNQHNAHVTQNALGVDPACSSGTSNLDSSSSSFPFNISDATLQPVGFHNSQQRVLLPADEQQLPARKELAGRGASIRRDGWRQRDGVGRDDSGGKSFVCNYCGKTLACFKNLKTHMRVHTGEKPFVCALCGKRFSDSSNLKRHQSVHTGEKRYGCVHCGKRFAQSGSLKVHMTVHTDCKQFSCSFCGKTFISSSHLRRHVSIHAEEKGLGDTLQ